MKGCSLSRSLHIIINYKHALKEVQCCHFFGMEKYVTASKKNQFCELSAKHNSRTHAGANPYEESARVFILVTRFN